MTDNNGTDLNPLKFHINQETSPIDIKVEEVDEEIIKTETEVSGGSWIYQNLNINELLANGNQNLEHSEEQLINENLGIKKEAIEDDSNIWERINNLSTNRQKDNKNGLEFDREEKVSHNDLIETVKRNNKKGKLKFLYDHNYCVSPGTLQKRVLASLIKCEKNLVLNHAKGKKQKSERNGYNASEKKHKCNECSYASVRKRNLLIHIQSHHTMERPHKCNECSYATAHKQEFLFHIKSHHTTEKPYKCNECSYAAVQKRSLLVHIKSHHTIEKPYKCSACSYAAAGKHHFLLHIKSRHTMDKAFKCNECSYETVRKYDLVSHIKQRHTVEKPYKCHECSYAAAQKHSSISH